MVNELKFAVNAMFLEHAWPLSALPLHTQQKCLHFHRLYMYINISAELQAFLQEILYNPHNFLYTQNCAIQLLQRSQDIRHSQTTGRNAETNTFYAILYTYIMVNSLILHDCSCMPAYILRMVGNIQGSTEFYIVLDTAYGYTHLEV